MDKYTGDKFSVLGHSLRQCDFDSLEDYQQFRTEMLDEAELSIPKKKIFLPPFLIRFYKEKVVKLKSLFW